MVTLRGEIIGLDYLKKLHEHNEEFGEMWKNYQKLIVDDFHVYDGFLIKGNQLCIIWSSLQEKVIQELHEGGLVGHLECKRLLMLTLTWPLLKQDIGKLYKHVILSNCQETSTKYRFIFVCAYSWKHIRGLVYGFCTWVTLYTTRDGFYTCCSW